MSWATRFRIRQNLKGSLWVIPLLGGFVGAALQVIVARVDVAIDLPKGWEYSASTANTILTAIVGAEVALTGFVVTVTALVIQTATEVFSARYMRLFYRDRLLKAVLAVLIGNTTFAFSMLRHVEENSVPNLGVTLAGFLVAFGLVLFLLFLDRFVHRLRPVAVAAGVAAAGKEVAVTEHPGAPRIRPPTGPAARDDEPAFVVHTPKPGTIQAAHIEGMIDWARRHDCLLVLPHAVGDFVPAGEPLLQVVGPVEESRAVARELRGMFALGVERTIEQDTAFAVRVMVDIAIRALSAAVNDPTTAVQVLDRLEDLLQTIGSLDLSALSERFDEQGNLRLVLPERRWEEYLTLAVTEIRMYGGSSIQVSRRLRALLLDLEDEVRPEHRGAIALELAKLDASVPASTSPIDAGLAAVADRQGIGGPNPNER